MKPRLGMIVHYLETAKPSRCRAAIVTDEAPEAVSLELFGPTLFRTKCVDAVAEDQNMASANTWHWPGPCQASEKL